MARRAVPGHTAPMPRLFPAFILSATLAVLSAPWALNQPVLSWVFKPLATALVIAFAWRRGEPGSLQRRAILGGLLLSWLGDVALLWPRQGFVPGLVAFLLAHLAYLLAFTRQARFGAWWPAFAAYALVAGGILALLWPGVPAPLRGAVLAYVICLASMARRRWCAGTCGAARTRPRGPGPRRSAAPCSSFPTPCWPPTASPSRCPLRASSCCPPTGPRSG